MTRQEALAVGRAVQLHPYGGDSLEERIADALQAESQAAYDAGYVYGRDIGIAIGRAEGSDFGFNAGYLHALDAIFRHARMMAEERHAKAAVVVESEETDDD